MIKVSNVSVMNFENAIRGMRNPLNSWDRSDSFWDVSSIDDNFILGENDLALAMKLANAGSDDRKFLRQIFVSVDILAPLYWWKEFDTYKVGTVANSCSTMHKIHDKEFGTKPLAVKFNVSAQTITNIVHNWNWIESLPYSCLITGEVQSYEQG